MFVQPACGALVPLWKRQVSECLTSGAGGGGGDPTLTVSWPAAEAEKEALVRRPIKTQKEHADWNFININHSLFGSRGVLTQMRLLPRFAFARRHPGKTDRFAQNGSADSHYLEMGD